MCGICGFTGNIENREAVLRNMTEVITHRGPDSDGFFVDENINMGFRRLSIIDLETGHQPIYNEDKTLVLTFNGEIYNYKALRKALIESGHKFSTEADSEVLVHGFEEWGEDMLPKLRGMFAFAIYNTQNNSLFLARDFFGIKPLHYTQIGEDFVYASEIKSILEHPNFEKRFNKRALDTYLSFQYAVPPETFFEDVYCLLPGHYLWYRDGVAETTRYFEAKFRPDNEMSEKEAVDKIEKVFENSVNAHKIADVEVGCFLSSGVDSSYVSTYFADQKTFTVGFDFGEKYNEISWAQGLSEKIGVEHHTHLISSDEFWDAVPTVQYYMDQPLADPSCVALYFVSRLASEYVKVVLSGEGADELFGGYTCYNDPGVFRIYQKIVPHFLRKALRALAKKLPDIKGRDYVIRACDPLEQRYIGNAFMYDRKEKQGILKDPSIATDPLRLVRRYYYRCRRYDDVTKMQYLDINLWMTGDILLKADRMSMANSLELRVPFLDKEVFKVASSLPTDLRVNKHNTKYAMRKAAARHLPEETAEKEKLGFPVPTRVWLREEKFYNIVKKRFKSETAEKFFNTDALVAWLDEHYSGKEDNSRRVWTVYVFLVWYDIYFNGDSDKVEKPENHLDELKAAAEAKREKQLAEAEKAAEKADNADPSETENADGPLAENVLPPEFFDDTEDDETEEFAPVRADKKTEAPSEDAKETDNDADAAESEKVEEPTEPTDEKGSDSEEAMTLNEVMAVLTDGAFADTEEEPEAPSAETDGKSAEKANDALSEAFEEIAPEVMEASAEETDDEPSEPKAENSGEEPAAAAEEKAEEKSVEAKEEKPAEKATEEKAAEAVSEEPKAAEEPKAEITAADSDENNGEEYVNIQSPREMAAYRAPQKPLTPQEQLEMALESIEKRSKYLDEPNVISDEAVDNIVSQINFFDETND